MFRIDRRITPHIAPIEVIFFQLFLAKPCLFSVFPRQAVADYTNIHSETLLSAISYVDQENNSLQSNFASRLSLITTVSPCVSTKQMFCYARAYETTT